MKTKDVKLKGMYWTKVSGKPAIVLLSEPSPYGGWNGLNLFTSREVRIRSPRRLKREITEKELLELKQSGFI